MNNKIKFLNLALGIVLLASCSSSNELPTPVDDEAIIHVGGINTNDMVSTADITRTSLDDKDLEWLKNGLKKGMDIFFVVWYT